jgi:cytoskeletal protein CcmA (bactofilin family)
MLTDESGKTSAEVNKPKEKRANIGTSVLITGELTASEDLMVDGRVDGRINLPDHALTIGPNAHIQATIVARAVTVFGSVSGDIAAREMVEIRRGASLQGDVVCARITIQEGALFCGKVDMESENTVPILVAV